MSFTTQLVDEQLQSCSTKPHLLSVVNVVGGSRILDSSMLLWRSDDCHTVLKINLSNVYE